MKFDTVAAALAHKFAGNHAADNDAFIAIDRLCEQPHVTKAERKQLRTHVSREGMGFA